MMNCYTPPLLPSFKAVASLSALLALSASSALAYPYDDSQSDISTTYATTGVESRTDGTVETYNIPVSNWADTISFTKIQGGDGGRAKAKASIGSDKNADGGGGALIVATFAIHPTNANALRPGGEIRFIIGSKGGYKSSSSTSAAGGGGGTGILYRDPEDGASWQLLALAGGGGGGSASAAAFDTYSKTGKNANSGEDADDGGGNNGGAGGSNGGQGTGYTNQSGGGASYTIDAAGSHGGDKGKYSGGEGGANDGGGSDGGFGCGGGGAGWSSSSDGRGGGGGGYSGGGGAGEDNSGGGAGSYLDSIASSDSITERGGSSKLNGAVEFTAARNSSNGDLAGATITLSGDSPMTIYDFDDLVDPGASAVDTYGQSIVSMTASSFNHQPGNTGTFSIKYTAIDQFGHTSSKTRTVYVVSGTAPTFSLIGDVSVSEDSGAYSKSSFAYNFNANDSGQSLDSYAVSNNNNALFLSQPSINTSGKLTFTPAGNANGSATVTVFATDEPDDALNGTSSNKTFTITVTSEDDAPTSISLSNNTPLENQTAIGTISATEPFGQSITYAITSGADKDFFAIDSASGVLSFVSALNFEEPEDSNTNNIYTVTVTVTGSDGSTNKNFNVYVSDTNDTPNTPVITTLYIDENTTLSGVVSSTDEDDDSLTYSITGGFDQTDLQIDEESGQLTFLTAPDFENPHDHDATGNYRIKVKAYDGTSYSSRGQFHLVVNDVNETPTAILLDAVDAATLSMREYVNNGSVLTTLSAEDPDVDDTFTYTLLDDSNGTFALDGSNLVLADSSGIDHNTLTPHTVEVQVSDADGLTLNKTITISITDVDESTIDGFREAYGLAADGSEDNDDASGNGVANILYLAFNLGDPSGSGITYANATSSTMGLPAFETTGATDTWTFTYVRLVGVSDVAYDAQYSTDLSTWTDAALDDALQSTTVTAIDADYEFVTLEFVLSGSSNFFRVDVGEGM